MFSCLIFYWQILKIRLIHKSLFRNIFIKEKLLFKINKDNFLFNWIINLKENLILY